MTLRVTKKQAKGWQALGRLKTGELNKTEQAYQAHLELLKRAGEIVWYKFEGIKLRLADNTFYSPDFAVMTKDCEIQIHEVKGAKGVFTDDAKVKVKVAAEMYPFKFIVVYPKPKKAGWEIEEFGA